MITKLSFQSLFNSPVHILITIWIHTPLVSLEELVNLPDLKLNILYIPVPRKLENTFASFKASHSSHHRHLGSILNSLFF